jgi:outer membrane protein, heavy metal efflux system
MRNLYCIGVLSVLVTVTVAASAAELPLTLEGAVEIGLAGAPQLAAEQAAIDGARASSISAGRLPDPALVAGVANLPSNGVDAWSFERDFMTMRTVGLMQSFPNRGKRRSEAAVAKATVAVAESQASQTRLELAQSIAQSWVTRYAAEVAAKNLQQLKPQLGLQADLARVAVASGGATAGDALTAQAAVAELDDRILALHQELTSAQTELTRWIGDAADQALALPPSFERLPASAADLLSSLHHHAALIAYDAKIAAANSEVAAANATKRPDWSAELDYSKRGRGYSDMVSLQFQVALPLFPGTRQDPAINAKRAAVRQLEAERETELRMHTAEISAMLNEWQSTKDRIALYEQERLPLARQRSELALAGLRAGRIDLRQSLIVLNEQVEIELSYATLLKSFGRSWAYLTYLPSQGAVQ